MFEYSESRFAVNLSTIRTFLAIAETGQLNRAAHALHVTQSTVTARLNSLEQALGQTLFLRRKSGAELTSAGFRFQRYAQLLDDTWRLARREAAMPADIEATFNFGCSADLWPRLGERLIEHLRDRHPAIALAAWSGEQPELERWLGSGLVDAALAYAPVARENHTAYPLREERLVLVSTRADELPRLDSDYVYVDAGEEFRIAHAAEYPQADSPEVTLASAAWACDYLLRHGGTGYLPLRLAETHLASGSMHRVAGAAEFTRGIYLVVNDHAAEGWSFLAELLELAGYRGGEASTV